MMSNYGSTLVSIMMFLSLLVSAVSAQTTIPVTDVNVRNGLSPYNWIITDQFLNSSICGASLSVAFKGTRQVAILVDSPMAKRKDPTRIPMIAWTVNGGPLQTYQFKLEEKSFVLSSGVQDPVIDLYIKGMSPSECRWGSKSHWKQEIPLNSLQILGFTVDAGGTTAPAPLPEKVWLNIGDSIMSGDGSLWPEKAKKRGPWAESGDARASYGYLLAKHYGYRESRLAFGGYNWAGGMAYVPPLTKLIDQQSETVSRLSDGVLKPAPAVTLINLGANGVTPEADIIEALKKVRSRIGKECKLIVMVPTPGTARDVTTQAFNSYKSGEKDERAYLVDLGLSAEQRSKFSSLMGKENLAYLVDLGKFSFSTADGLHPTAAGHQTIYETALPVFDAIIRGK